MSIQRSTTWGGDYHHLHSESEITTGTFYGFTVLEDNTVVSVMTGGPHGVIPSPPIDYRASSYCNITGKSLKMGTFVTIPLGHIIKNFDLSAGSVILHRES